MRLRASHRAQAIANLRALKVVALADGPLDERERAILLATRDSNGLDLSNNEVECLRAITAKDLAAAVEDPELRARLVEAMVLVARVDSGARVDSVDSVDSVDGDIGANELMVIRAFARALAVPVDELSGREGPPSRD